MTPNSSKSKGVIAYSLNAKTALGFLLLTQYDFGVCGSSKAILLSGHLFRRARLFVEYLSKNILVFAKCEVSTFEPKKLLGVDDLFSFKSL